MRKIYLALSIIAILTVIFSITSVKAFTTSFYVNVDPYGLGWTYLQGINPVYGESIYQDLIQSAAVPPKVHAGDVRLTPVSDGAGSWYPAGSTVTALDADLGLTLNTAARWGTVKHAENVLVDTYYDFGEYIYKDADSSNTVTTGDTRYGNVPGYKVASVVADGDTDIDTALTTFKGTEAAHYERFPDNLDATALAYDYARLYVDIMWTTDIPNNTPDGMRGYQVKVSVDPTVLTPLGVIGGVAGVYVLASYLSDIGSILSTGIVQNVQADYIEMSENILGAVANGAGDLYNGPYYKLVTLVFIPQSETGLSPIHMNPFPASGDYQDAGTETWHPVTLVDGGYNFVVPEFPTGIGVLVAMIVLIPIIYVWRTRKKNAA